MKAGDKGTEGKETWDRHWTEKATEGSLWEKAANVYRRWFIRREVKHYVEKHFSPSGIFVECGSGTSETSVTIAKQDRLIIALDFSRFPLHRAQKNPVIDFCIQADFFHLPFKDNIIDGIYNVGVMEHYGEQELKVVLGEFYRVLKKDGVCLFLWPQKYGWVELVSKIRPLFPQSPSMFDERLVLGLLQEAGFDNVSWSLSPFALFLHYAVVAQK